MATTEMQKVEIPALAYLALCELARRAEKSVEDYLNDLIATKAVEEMGDGQPLPSYPVPYPVPYYPWPRRSPRGGLTWL